MRLYKLSVFEEILSLFDHVVRQNVFSLQYLFANRNSCTKTHIFKKHMPSHEKIYEKRSICLPVREKIDISHLPSGMYYLRIAGKTVKVIKK